jgi:hypothetical protein
VIEIGLGDRDPPAFPHACPHSSFPQDPSPHRPGPADRS